MPWTPDQFPRLPTRVELIEESVERQEKQLQEVVAWTRRTAYSAVTLTLTGLGALVILLLDKVL